MTKRLDRRTFLKRSLLAGSAAVAWKSHEETALAAEIKSSGTRERALPSGGPLHLPKGRIKHLEISRVICGGNLMGGWAHSRDLIYVSSLLRAYHSDEKVFETLRLAEQRGVNTLLTNSVHHRVINDYWEAEDGRIQWIADCKSKDAIRTAIERGAHAVYYNGGMCDRLVRANDVTGIADMLKLMRDRGGKVCGLGAHSLDTVKRCMAAGLQPDFWVKTLHQDNYWSATPEKNRRPFDEVGERSPDHDLHHDNMFCTQPKETIAFMAALKTPWIAFKVLAAGAIHPRQAFPWAFQNGADFICVGMFDFQVVEDTAIAARALTTVAEKGRPRPWMA